MASILAANAIVSLANVRLYLRPDSTTDDTLYEKLINAASTLIENYCGRKFINQSITEKHDGDGENTLILKISPVVSITSIRRYYYDGTYDTIANTAGQTDAYEIDLTIGEIILRDSIFEEGIQNYQIVYVAGYGEAIANMPEDLQMAAIKEVEYLYKKGPADFSTTFAAGNMIMTEKELPTDVKTLLAAYIRPYMFA